MGVAMEASSSSHFLAEFISQFPVPLPVPAVNTDLVGSLLPAGSPLSSVESGYGWQPAWEPPLAQVSCGPFRLGLLSQPGSFFLSCLGTGPAGPQPVFVKLETPAAIRWRSELRRVSSTTSSPRS